MNPEEHHEWLRSIADRLERLAPVPNDVLSGAVVEHGCCFWILDDDEEPVLSGQEDPDRELAARLCEGCPVADHCLELELRWTGPDTAGVFGGLGSDDRRALFDLWDPHAGERARNDGGVS